MNEKESLKRFLHNQERYINSAVSNPEIKSALIRLSKCYAWNFLKEKELLNSSPRKNLESVVSTVFEYSFERLSATRAMTTNENKELLKEAASLIKKLPELLEKDRGDLGLNFLHELNSTTYKEALNRLLNGLIYNAETNGNIERGMMFSEDVESRLNSDFQHLPSTEDAYKTLKYCSDDEFFNMLENLLNQVETRCSDVVGYDRPNRESHKINSLSITLNHIFNHCYGSPLHNIVCELSSVIFDKDLNEDNIKKYWQRNKDKDIHLVYLH